MFWIGLISGIVLSAILLQLKTEIFTELIIYLKYEYEQRRKNKTG